MQLACMLGVDMLFTCSGCLPKSACSQEDLYMTMILIQLYILRRYWA